MSLFLFAARQCATSHLDAAGLTIIMGRVAKLALPQWKKTLKRKILMRTLRNFQTKTHEETLAGHYLNY